MPFVNTSIFQPGSVKSFATAQNPKSLPAGYAAALVDIRLGDGLLRTRWGDETIAGSLTGSIKGAYEATMDGNQYLFRAAKETGDDDSPHISIYVSENNGNTWSRITSTAGAYGDTRFTGDIAEPVRFCVVKDRVFSPYDEHDLVVIQNGSEAPRIYGKSNALSTVSPAGTLGCAVVTQPQAVDASMAYTWYAPSWLSDIGEGLTTFTNTIGITSTNDGSTPNSALEVVVDSAYIAGATSIWTLNAPMLLDQDADPSQVIMVGYSPTTGGDPRFWQQVKIEATDASGIYQTIYDPSNPQSAIFLPIETDTDRANENWYQMAFSLNDITLTRINKFKISWTGDVPSSSITGYMVVTCAGGSVPGTTRYGIAYYGSDIRATGPGLILTSIRAGTVYSFGGGARFGGVGIVEDPRFYFRYRLTFANTTGAQRDAGIDYALIYRSSPGESGYYFTKAWKIARWNGSAWLYINTLGQGYVDRGDEENFSHQCPDAGIVGVPTGTAMCTANGRFLVGTSNRLWVSESDQPFLFRKAVRFLDATTADPTSGTSMAFDGQTVQALVPLGSFAGAAEDLSTPISGATTVHVLTDRNMFQLSGFDAASLSRPIPSAPYGTLSPMSVGRSRSGFFWLDHTGQISFYSPAGLQRLSVSMVDDITTTIPVDRKVWVWGACANDRYYMAYTPRGGEANSHVLVWYERSGSFESIDTASPTAEALVPYYADGYVKLLRFGDSALYEHERPNCTADVSLSLIFRAYHENGLKQISAGDMTVWVDGPESGTFTLETVRTGATGETAAGSIDVDAQRVYLEDAGHGLTSWSVQPSISGTVPGGTRVHAVLMNMESAPSAAYRP